MDNFRGVFERHEKKYRISEDQHDVIIGALKETFAPDAHGPSVICNLYYDTRDRHLIERSLEKPTYKEKFRVRSYGIPTAETVVFVEIKKKFKGVVYKRRVAMTYAAARAYLSGVDFQDACADYPAFDASGHAIEPSTTSVQIAREIDWMRTRYNGLEPAMFISCEREAYLCRDDANLRITFDGNILWRDEGLDFTFGVAGHPLLSRDERIMEIKCAGPLPLWLTHQLSELKIYPDSFSKYGNAYRASFSEFLWEAADDVTFSAATQKVKKSRETRVTEKGGVRCA